MSAAPLVLIDCNNFYVSCERVFDPRLAGVPVLVLVPSSNDGFLAVGNAALPRRFTDEARASLPAMGLAEGAPGLDEVYAAVGLQRLRLHQDQQVPERAG